MLTSVLNQVVQDLVMDEEMKRDVERVTIPGKMLRELGMGRRLGETLVFGCGRSDLPQMVAQYDSDAIVTAYDIDKVKVEENKNLGWLHSRVINTSDTPEILFDTLVAHAVLHESPQKLATEAISFVKPGGLIGIIDYDMKESSRNDFFMKWGICYDEKIERAKLGDDVAYRMHTSFGLEDCSRTMEMLGIEPVYLAGKMRGVLVQTLHFIYVGRKPN